VRRRACSVDPGGTGLTEADIRAAERARLVAPGAAAAREFLARWDRAGYPRERRGVDPQG
jgi:NTE family protein